jgi:hypothetical protein
MAAWLDQVRAASGLTLWALANLLAGRCGYPVSSIWRQLHAYRRGRTPRPGGWLDRVPEVAAAARHPDDPEARARLQEALTDGLARARQQMLAARRAKSEKTPYPD